MLVHAVAVRQGGIAERAVMMRDVPAVELEDQPSVPDEPLVLGATMIAPTKTAKLRARLLADACSRT